MFRIKICGVTNFADAQLVGRSGADAIGLNFYPGSSRHVTVATARSIVDSLPDGVAAVGVFVNAELDELRQVHDELGLDYLQLHGDEPDEWINDLAPRRVIRAIRCSDASFEPVLRFLERCRTGDRLPAALLVDAYHPGEYGGTGRTVDWRALREVRPPESPVPLVLAGGLTPGNVREAIQLARPDAVDTASGVESSPGQKDAEKVELFVREAKLAFLPDLA